MKKFLAIIILSTFITLPSKADNIKDFQIEGISVGDSLLKHFPESEIKRFFNYDNLPSDMKFRIAEVSRDETKKKFNIYDSLQFSYKPNDKNYILYSIGGLIFCNSNKECSNLKEELLQDITSAFKSTRPQNSTVKHPDDKSGKSTVEISRIITPKNGVVAVKFFNWSNKVEWKKNIRVTVNTDEVNKWQHNNYGAK
ncbi:MAG: hypothetical protein ISQ17_02270 [Pelagibacteraceae bacterium]|jgi:hypothetical protein|nr:hypothetical protein [Pelagibacteraceae bacterium]